MMLRLGRGLQLATMTPHEPSLDKNPSCALSALPPVSSSASHGPPQLEARRRESPYGLAYSEHGVGEVGEWIRMEGSQHAMYPSNVAKQKIQRGPNI